MKDDTKNAFKFTKNMIKKCEEQQQQLLVFGFVKQNSLIHIPMELICLFLLFYKQTLHWNFTGKKLKTLLSNFILFDKII